MCYSANNNNDRAKLAAKLKKSVKDIATKNAVFLSGFNHPPMHIIKQEEPDVIDVAYWGLIPSFITEAEKAKEYFKKTLNAKAETIFEKVSFKSNILPRRCLIPLSGFYEWRDVNKVKFPYHISANKDDLFYVAGIYDYWTRKDTGKTFRSFSMVTTESNPLMTRIHNLKKRQPLMFDLEAGENWIRNDLKQDDIIELMQPTPQSFLKAHTINKINSDTDIISDSILKPAEYPEVKRLDIIEDFKVGQDFQLTRITGRVIKFKLLHFTTPDKKIDMKEHNSGGFLSLDKLTDEELLSIKPIAPEAA
ncbi:MAG: SOS response-associated peptidase [Bacteroidota bacterium]